MRVRARLGFAVLAGSHFLGFGLLGFGLLGCASAPAPKPSLESEVVATDSGSSSMVSSSAVSDAAAPSLTAAELAAWRDLLAADGEVPDDRDVGELSLELVDLLGSPDPEIRDGIAYTLLDRWILRTKILEAAQLRALTRPLSTALQWSDDSSRHKAHRRSFSALTLAALVRRDAELSFLTTEELADLVSATASYAAQETDLRGHVEEEGWVHAAAHTADLLAALASHPKVTEKDAAGMLVAVAELCVRRHGFILHHGEDARLAEPVLRLVQRGFVADSLLESWIKTLTAPFRERGQGGFDGPLYAAQRNARNLLFTLHTRLSLVESPSAEQRAALLVLTNALRG